MISVIIPTLNEEKNISRVVSQFKGIKNIEVIVADGSSEDDTVKIAKKLGAKVYQNPRDKQNIAKNRNFGAKYAQGEILIFCDADTKFKSPKKALKKIKETMEDGEIVGGILKIEIFPRQEKLFDKIAHKIYNKIIQKKLSTKKPIGSGQCQIIKKKEFEKIKGYPNIPYQEDTEIFRNLRKLGKLHYFDDITIYESPRRYRKKGYVFLGIKALYSLIIRQLFHREVVKKWERVN